MKTQQKINKTYISDMYLHFELFRSAGILSLQTAE